MQQDSERFEKESWGDYFDSVREMVGNRPGLELFKADPMSGSWPCELWMVVYHRGSKAISVLHGKDQYLGGAHGQRQVSHSNYIDGPAGVERLDFAALFTRPKGWQDDVRQMILKDLRRQGALWVQPEFRENAPAEMRTPMLELTDAEMADLKFTVSVRRTPWFPTRTGPGDGEGCMTTNALADGAINPRSINWSGSSGLQGSASMSSPKRSECIR